MNAADTLLASILRTVPDAHFTVAEMLRTQAAYAVAFATARAHEEERWGASVEQLRRCAKLVPEFLSAKAAKNYERSDFLRAELAGMGVDVNKPQSWRRFLAE